MSDIAIEQAGKLVDNAPQGAPAVRTFFDEATFTATHVVSDPASGKAAIVDSVLDFDPASGSTSTRSADAVIAHIESHGLSVEWLLETHAHADQIGRAHV